MSEAPESARTQRGRVGSRAVAGCGTAGALATLTCMLTCCLPAILLALGAGSSGAAGMAGMSHHQSHGTFGGLLHALHQISPALLIVSIVLVAGAFALRRPAAVVPALLAGVVLYVSVHAQPEPAVMYAGMALGYGTWIGLYLWTRRTRGRETPTECG